MFVDECISSLRAEKHFISIESPLLLAPRTLEKPSCRKWRYILLCPIFSSWMARWSLEFIFSRRMLQDACYSLHYNKLNGISEFQLEACYSLQTSSSLPLSHSTVREHSKSMGIHWLLPQSNCDSRQSAKNTQIDLRCDSLNSETESFSLNDSK